MDKTPASLLYRLRHQPAPQDWQRFVVVFTPILYRWAGRLGAQPADAADLVQEVLINVVRRIQSFEYDPSQSFRAWLYVLLRRTWARRHRRSRREAGQGDDLDRLPDERSVQEDEDYRRQVVGRVAQLIRGDFEPRTWQAVWESISRDVPLAVVAEKHGMTISALYAARHRVLARFRVELDGFLS